MMEGTDTDDPNLELLPAEVLCHVCSYLDGDDMVALASASPALHRVANDLHPWRTLLRSSYGLGVPRGQQQPQPPPTAETEDSETARWKRQYFTRRKQWEGLRQASLKERITLSAQWEAIDLFRELVENELEVGVNELIGDRNVLHIVCNSGSLDLIRVLIEEFNADTNAKSLVAIDTHSSRERLPPELYYHTPLSLAVASEREDSVRWMLEHGARAELHDCLICLIVASQVGHQQLAQLFLERLKPFRLGGGWLAWLLSQENQDASSKMMENAFLVAVENACTSNVAVLKLLLSNMPTRLKQRATTALATAVNADRVESVSELLKAGVPAANRPGEWGVIHRAASIGNLEIIKLLVEYGADAGAPTAYNGDNAHLIALRSHGKPDVVEYLRQAPSANQKDAQLIFNIAIAVLGLLLALTFWFTF